MAQWEEVLVASQGTIVVNDTNEKTVTHDAIFVLEDTVFNSIKVAGVDIKADLISTPGTAVKAGAMLRASGARKFSGVDLASGSVVLIL
jgi:hypothetical protein